MIIGTSRQYLYYQSYSRVTGTNLKVISVAITVDNLDLLNLDSKEDMKYIRESMG